MYKIAIIDHVGSKAGMDYYSSSLAKGFISQNINCTVYSNFVGIDPENIDYKVYFFRHTRKNAFFKMLNLLFATIKSSYAARKQKTDLVILHLFSANIVTLFLVMLPKLFGLKIAIISHDISSFINNDSVLIQNLIYNFFANNIIVHNTFSYKELFKHIKLTNPEKVVVIKHGGYIEHIVKPLSKTTARKALGLDIHGKYILFFGQIKDVKGLDILLEAMQTIPKDIKLIIAGKPWKSDFSKYTALIKKYKLDNRIVKMVRFIEDDEREQLFFAADVNVLPYRIIYQSGVLLMAMSYALPIIASDLPANREIVIDGDNGMLFERCNADSLSHKITLFFKLKDKGENLAHKALETIQTQYDWADISKQYIKILKSGK